MWPPSRGQDVRGLPIRFISSLGLIGRCDGGAGRQVCVMLSPRLSLAIAENIHEIRTGRKDVALVRALSFPVHGRGLL